MKNTKKFICLDGVDGVDGVGKSSVGLLLARRLGCKYYKSPGGIFEEYRKTVDDNVDILTRYFFYRAVCQNDSKLIKELLNDSGVVCDRYIYSTFLFHLVKEP